MSIRHSTFIIGPTGTCRTKVYQMTAKATDKTGTKVIIRDVNPKVQRTNDF